MRGELVLTFGTQTSNSVGATAAAAVHYGARIRDTFQSPLLSFLSFLLDYIMQMRSLSLSSFQCYLVSLLQVPSTFVFVSRPDKIHNYVPRSNVELAASHKYASTLTLMPFPSMPSHLKFSSFLVRSLLISTFFRMVSEALFTALAVNSVESAAKQQ